jgi:hypothetical protein
LVAGWGFTTSEKVFGSSLSLDSGIVLYNDTKLVLGEGGNEGRFELEEQFKERDKLLIRFKFYKGDFFGQPFFFFQLFLPTLLVYLIMIKAFFGAFTI